MNNDDGGHEMMMTMKCSSSSGGSSSNHHHRHTRDGGDFYYLKSDLEHLAAYAAIILQDLAAEADLTEALDGVSAAHIVDLIVATTKNRNYIDALGGQ